MPMSSADDDVCHRQIQVAWGDDVCHRPGGTSASTARHRHRRAWEGSGAEGHGPCPPTLPGDLRKTEHPRSGGSEMGERTRYEPGTFCWAGLATSDPAAATAFYARLFDWEAEPLPAGEPGAYTILRHAGQDVAILYRQTAQARAAGAP